MTFDPECWSCADEDVQGSIGIEAADFLADSLQAMGKPLERSEALLLASDLVELVLERVSKFQGATLERVARPAAARKYQEECSRAGLWLEVFAPQLQEIAQQTGWPVQIVKDYAHKRIRREYTYTDRSIMRAVDPLIEQHPLDGPWWQQAGGITAWVEVGSNECVQATRYWREGDDYESQELVDCQTAIPSGFRCEVSTRLRTGEILCLSVWNTSAYLEYQSQLAACMESDDAPLPKHQRTCTIAYVRAADGRLVYVGDSSEERIAYRDYLYRGTISLAELVCRALARPGNGKGHPKYKHGRDVL